MTAPRFTGRTAIITGGAQGIGRGIAMRLAREGAAVALVDIQADAGQQLTESLNAEGHSAAFFACDVTEESAVMAMVRDVLTWTGNIDYLINNAGASPRRDLMETTYAEWQRLLNLNLGSQFLCARACFDALRATHGAIVNIASLHAWSTVRGLSAYAAAKGGVVALTNSLAIEFAPDVRVNGVAPGLIETEAWYAAVGDVDAARAQRLPYHLVGRLGQPADIAGPVAFLLSEDAAFINGVTLPVDGGLTSQLYRG